MINTYVNELDLKSQQLNSIMIDSHKTFQNSNEDSINKLIDYWEFLAKYHYRMTDTVINEIKQLKKNYSDDEILISMDIAKDQYFKYENQIVTYDSYTFAFSKISGILNGRKHPEIGNLFYIRGILKNRIKTYFDNEKCLFILKDAYEKGLSIEELTTIAKRAINWQRWKEDICYSLEEKNKK